MNPKISDHRNLPQKFGAIRYTDELYVVLYVLMYYSHIHVCIVNVDYTYRQSLTARTHTYTVHTYMATSSVLRL